MYDTKLSLNENAYSVAITKDSLVNLTGGLYYSVVLLSSGKLYTFGENQYNQMNYIILNYNLNILSRKLRFHRYQSYFLNNKKI